MLDSACSVQLVAAPSSVRVHNLHLVTSDLAAARARLLRRGVAVSAIRHKAPLETRSGGWDAGLDSQRRDYASFACCTNRRAIRWHTSRWPTCSLAC